MADIKSNNYIYKFDDNDPDIDTLNFVKFMKCDINSKHLALVGK
jgi:hypothetical protein